jgi:hypothetical protein
MAMRKLERETNQPNPRTRWSNEDKKPGRDTGQPAARPPLGARNKTPLPVRLLLCLFAFSLCFEYWDLLMVGSFTVPKVIGLALFGAAMCYITAVGTRPTVSTILLFILWFWCVATTVLNAQSKPELWDVVSEILIPLLECLVFYWLVQGMFRDKRAAFLTLMAFTAGCVCIAALMPFGFGAQTAQEGGFFRVTFFGTNSNTLGVYMVIAIVTVVGVVIENPLHSGRWRYCLLAALPILCKAAFDTGSRGALVSLALGLLAFGFTRRSFLMRTFIWAQLILMGVLTFYYVTQSDILMYRLDLTLDSGWGFSGMSRAFLTSHGVPDPHNGFLTFYVVAGIVGGTLFLLLAVRWILKAFVARKSVWGCIPLALALVMLSTLAKGGGFYLQKVLWVFLGFVECAGLHMASRQPGKQPAPARRHTIARKN